MVWRYCGNGTELLPFRVLLGKVEHR
jgi:hypothetical protein